MQFQSNVILRYYHGDVSFWGVKYQIFSHTWYLKTYMSGVLPFLVFWGVLQSSCRPLSKLWTSQHHFCTQSFLSKGILYCLMLRLTTSLKVPIFLSEAFFWLWVHHLVLDVMTPNIFCPYFSDLRLSIIRFKNGHEPMVSVIIHEWFIIITLWF